MLSIMFGLICLLFSAIAVLPLSFGLGWTGEFLFVLKGAVPLFAIMLGLVCVLIGMADVVDRKHAKKEAIIQEEFEKQQAKERSQKSN